MQNTAKYYNNKYRHSLKILNTFSMLVHLLVYLCVQKSLIIMSKKLTLCAPTIKIVRTQQAQKLDEKSTVQSERREARIFAHIESNTTSKHPKPPVRAKEKERKRKALSSDLRAFPSLIFSP